MSVPLPARTRPALPRRSSTLPPSPPPPDPSLPDDLRSYPLRIRSDICKATGGGRWTPKPSPIPDYMKRVPGRKAPYEIALEEEEAAARRARANPVIRDGGTLVSLIVSTPPGHQLMILPVFAQTSNTDHHARMSPAYQSDRSSSPLSNFARAVPPLMPRSHLSGLFWSLVIICCCSSYLWLTLSATHIPTLPTVLIYNFTYTAYRPTPPCCLCCTYLLSYTCPRL